MTFNETKLRHEESYIEKETDDLKLQWFWRELGRLLLTVLIAFWATFALWSIAQIIAVFVRYVG